MSNSGSCTTTNPNTPRSPGVFQEELPWESPIHDERPQVEVPEEEVPQVELPQGHDPQGVPQCVEDVCSSVTSSSASFLGCARDIHSTWPIFHELANIPAMATWGPPDQPPSAASLDNLGLYLYRSSCLLMDC